MACHRVRWGRIRQKGGRILRTNLAAVELPVPGDVDFAPQARVLDLAAVETPVPVLVDEPSVDFTGALAVEGVAPGERNGHR